MEFKSTLIIILLIILLYLAYRSLPIPLADDASIKVTGSGNGNPLLKGFSVNFKTSATEGLVFANQPEANKYVAIYLKAGKPVVEGQIAASTPAKITFDTVVNDGKDHVVTVIHETGKVTANLDDGNFKEQTLANATQAFTYGKMQIGSGADLTGLSVDANKQFIGCISYINLPKSPLTSANFKLDGGLSKDCSV